MSTGPRREVAYRVFADEFNDAHYTYAESDEERAPNYLVTPTGARVNRLFVVGVLTEVEEVSDDVLRARIVDPTGAFVLYAGQYQPDALAFFERTDPPSFVAVTGKARTFQPEGSDRVFTSIRPETVNEVDADTRDRWVVQTAEHTLERVAIFAKALETGLVGGDLQDTLAEADVRHGLAAGIPRAIDAYGTTTGYLASIQSMAVDAARLVANEIDAVEREPLEPDEGGDAPVDTSFADDVVIAPGTTAAAGKDGDEEPAPAQETQPPTAGEADAEGTETASESRSAPATVDEATAEAGVDESAVGQEDGEPDTAEPGAAEPSTEPETEVPTDEPATEEPTDQPATEEQIEQPAAAEQTAESDIDSRADNQGDETAETTDEMYELSEEERREVEENFDVGFESGAEVGEPAADEAGTPENGAEPGARQAEDTMEESPDEPTEDATDSEATVELEDEESGPGSETGDEEPGGDSDASEQTATEESEAAAEQDQEEPGAPEGDELEDVVVEAMQSEGDADGIERDALLDHVSEEYGASEADIEAAIQDALLGGRCFESGEDRLKPI